MFADGSAKSATDMHATWIMMCRQQGIWSYVFKRSSLARIMPDVRLRSGIHSKAGIRQRIRIDRLRRNSPLPIPRRFQQNPAMENQTGPAGTLREFVRWAMTPPQSVAVYLACLLLVAGLSFYVGTLKPKKTVGLNPPPVSAPRN
jgi:hypothetical protein